MLHCKSCKFVKNDGDFYAGNQTTCKECVKAKAREHRRNNIDHYRAYDRARGNRQPKEYLAQYRGGNAIKYKAHNAVNNAVRDGKIEPSPCEMCGATPAHAHHDDYTRPLDVRWLCPAHHHQWHAENGEAKVA